MSQSLRASLLSSAFCLAAVTAAHAQGAAPGVEAVTVTGTHIQGVEVPVVNIQTLDRAQIEQSGANQIAELVNQIPSNAGTTLYNENGQLSGTAQFELRGLGFSSTLVLLNGRRAGVAPLSDKSGADFVDINQFPLAMVKRVEVLKDGSSAIYGSEAVAGVVNIITRKGFDGLELSANFASSTNKAYSLNLAAGQTFNRGSFNFYATYYQQGGNLRSDFPWLTARVGGNGTPGLSQLINNNGYPGTYQLATVNGAGQPAPASGALNVPDPGCQAAGGVFKINNGVTDTTVCNDNFANQIGVVPAETRIQGFFEGDYNLTERLRFFNETGVSRNFNKVFEHGPGYSNGAAVGGLISVPASAPFNFFIRDPANPRNIIAVDPSQWNSAVNQAVAVVGNFRPQGNFITAQKLQTNTYIRVVNGLEYDFGGNWHASLSHEYAYAEYIENNPLGINTPALTSLINSGQYNPFATSVLSPSLVSPKDHTTLAANPQSVINQIFYTTNVERRTDQNVFDASASGPLLDLPTGPLSAAIGGQYRSQTLNVIPDSLTAAGLGTVSTKDAAFTGVEHVWSEYAEAILPIYDVAEIQAAVRHEDYGSSIGATTDPKVTARLNLFPGLVDLRASWGTSFQAPTLTQGATSQILTVLNDSVVVGPSGLQCTANTIGAGANVVTTGGGLKPQRSRNYNLGADISPLSNLKLSVDFWHYSYTNLIAAGQNAQAIVNGECVNGRFVDDPRVVRVPTGGVSVVNTSYVNVGKVVTEGIDLSATYNTSLDSYGDLAFRTDATYVNAFNVYGANGTVINDVGNRNFTNNFAPMPYWRGSAHAVWTFDVHELTLGLNYTGGYRNDQSNNAPVDDFKTVDIRYALRLEELFGLKDGFTSFAVGMNNMFDAAPPALARYTTAGVPVTGSLAVDRPGYDSLSGANIQGRSIYIQLKQAF